MHVAPTGATEYWPAVQFVHVTSTVVVHAAAPRRVPAGHTVQGLQEVAFAADQLTPAVQVEHTALVVGVQVEERYLPAVHTLEAQAAQGARPVADHVPGAHGVATTHESEVAFQA